MKKYQQIISKVRTKLGLYPILQMILASVVFNKLDVPLISTNLFSNFKTRNNNCV